LKKYYDKTKTNLKMDPFGYSILFISLLPFASIFGIVVSICHFTFHAFVDGQLPTNEKEWFEVFTMWWWFQAFAFVIQCYIEHKHIDILKILPGVLVWLWYSY
jgi:hypothetical protein